MFRFTYFLNCLTSEENSIFFSVNPEKRREDFSKNESPIKSVNNSFQNYILRSFTLTIWFVNSDKLKDDGRQNYTENKTSPIATFFPETRF